MISNDQWVRMLEFAASLPDAGCYATRRIYLDQAPIFWMDRDEDGWWTFMAEDDTDETINDVENVRICSIREIAVVDPAIVPYLNEPGGTYLHRTPDQEFTPD